MKISTIEVDGEIALGVAVEGGFALATGWTGGERDLVHALATDTLSELAPLTSAKADVSFEEVRFLPPVPAPGKIICVGVNYDAHREEMGRVKVGYPTLFVRWPSSVVGHRQPILRPKVSERFDYEGELAVIIGRRGREAPAAEALSLVAGYACFNDGSVRDYQRHSSQFTPGKNFEASGGFGPWMVTPDEIPDPSQLELTTRLDGEVLQHAFTRDLVFDIPQLIEYITTFTTLEPGDVIATGTPGGVGDKREPPVYMRPGQTLEIEISGVGTLVHPIAEA